MNGFFDWAYTGAPFQLFGTAHLIALGVIGLIILLLPQMRGHEKAQQIFRYGVAGLLVVNELGWHLWHIVNGQWTVQTMLPLHLCSVLVFVSAAMLVTEKYRMFEFVYFMGIAGALQALLTPDLAIYGYPHYRFWQTFISHGSIVISAIFMAVVIGYRPTWRSLGRVLIGTNLYMLFVGGVNWLLGSNYMFIARKPDTASLMDVLGPWPLYLISLEAIGLAMCLILFVPYMRRVKG